jgi:hypothetical protein
VRRWALLVLVLLGCRYKFGLLDGDGVDGPPLSLADRF